MWSVGVSEGPFLLLRSVFLSENAGIASSQASNVTHVASGTCCSVPHWVPMVLQERGSSPAAGNDSSMPPFLDFISFWVLSKTMLPVPSQLPDVRQKGQLCFGLNTSHLVFIFSKRFE